MVGEKGRKTHSQLCDLHEKICPISAKPLLAPRPNNLPARESFFNLKEFARVSRR